MSAEQHKRRASPSGLGGKQGRYANFFQIGHNEFEFLIEFGQQGGGVHTRIYVTPQYARVFSDLLRKTLSEHEEDLAQRKTSPEH